MCDLREKVARALWKVNCCDSTYDEALNAAKRGPGVDSSSILFIHELADAAIAAMPAPMSVAEAAQVDKWTSELQEAITEMRYSILVQRASDRVRSVVQEMLGNEALASPEGE